VLAAGDGDGAGVVIEVSVVAMLEEDGVEEFSNRFCAFWSVRKRVIEVISMALSIVYVPRGCAKQLRTETVSDRGDDEMKEA
jgi:hypothetical protein